MTTLHKKLWTWQYILILTLTFLFCLSLQALLGGFPIYVIQISDNPTSGGLMTSAFMVAAIVSRPIISIILNKIDIKRILIIAMVYTFLTILLSFFWKSVSILVVLRILQGLGFGTITTLLATAVTNIVPDSRLGEGIGYFGMATSIGTTLGPMVAFMFIHGLSFYALLIFSMILIGIIFIGALLFKNDEVDFHSEPQVSEKSWLQSAFDKKALIPCLMLFIFYITYTGHINFLDELGKSLRVEHTSIFFLILVIMVLITRPFSGKIYDWKGHRFLLYPSIISGTIGLILLTYMQNISMLIWASVFYGIAYGVIQPTLQTWAVQRVHSGQKATANAMTLSSMDLGHAFGAILLGMIANMIGYQSMYILLVVLGVILLLGYAGFNHRDRFYKQVNNE